MTLTATRQRPIGVFGGTFDPIHNAHLRVALDAQERLGLAQVRFLPSARPPHRDHPDVSADTRARLLDVAVADQPGFVVDRRELERAGPSYMIDTLASLRHERPQTPLCLLLGHDAFLGLTSWHRWRELCDLAHLVVMSRPGYWEPLPAALRALVERHGSNNIDALAARPAGQLLMLDVTRLELSASDLRERLASGRSVRFLTPDAVCRAIDRAHLYRRPAPRSEQALPALARTLK